RIVALEGLSRFAECPHERPGDHDRHAEISSLPPPGLTCHLAHPVGLRQRRLRFRQHQASGLGQLDSMAVTHEKRNAQIALKRLDALRQRWLSDVEARGRAAEMPFLREYHEIGQLLEGQVCRRERAHTELLLLTPASGRWPLSRAAIARSRHQRTAAPPPDSSREKARSRTRPAFAETHRPPCPCPWLAQPARRPPWVSLPGRIGRRNSARPCSALPPRCRSGHRAPR